MVHLICHSTSGLWLWRCLGVSPFLRYHGELSVFLVSTRCGGVFSCKDGGLERVLLAIDAVEAREIDMPGGCEASSIAQVVVYVDPAESGFMKGDGQRHSKVLGSSVPHNTVERIRRPQGSSTWSHQLAVRRRSEARGGKHSASGSGCSQATSGRSVGAKLLTGPACCNPDQGSS